MKELRLILIGRSGHGKSATGNTILQGKKFKTCISSTAVTSKSSLEEVIYGNYKLKVIDTPGFFDIQSPDKDMYEWMKTETMKSIALSESGPNAFLYVLKFGRHTEDDIQSMKKLLQVYGPSMKEYMIFVFTHFNEIKDEYNTLDHYITNLSPVLLDIINDCGKRVLAIDNRNGSAEEKSMFMNQLIEMLQTMEGKHYTNDAFKETTLLFDRQVKEIMETKNMSKDDAQKAVLSDIQKEGIFFKVLKEKKYSLLATFVTPLISMWFLGPTGLVLGFLASAVRWATYNCK